MADLKIACQVLKTVETGVIFECKCLISTNLPFSNLIITRNLYSITSLGID